MSETLGNDIIRHQLERLARRERGRLVADIVSRIGAQRLQLAEDVVQDAVVAAMANWPYKGLPDNPAAWLNRVARNKAYDRLRRQGRELPLDNGETETQTPADDQSNDGAYFGAKVEDSELKLMFLCCQSTITAEDQLMLTLKVVSGFTAKDIGHVFLKKDAAVGQRLARAKRKLRESQDWLADGLSRFEVKKRLPVVLKVIYLMFSLGYAPRRGDTLILRDVAEEALRLALLVTNLDEAKTPEAHALASLLAFQASRFDARTDGEGKLILLRDQNRNLWNRQLIDLAFGQLKQAQSGDSLSRYHLEAAIAAGHASAPEFSATDWQQMLRVYESLETMTGSPIVAINACVARAFSGEAEVAFLKLETLAEHENLRDFAPYHMARAELLRMLKRPEEAAKSFRSALACDASAPVVNHLKDRLATCV